MTVTPYKDIGDRLKWHREYVGLTQEEYAESIGVARSSYTVWETGVRRFSLDGALLIKKRWGLSLDWLIEGNADALASTVRNAWLSRSAVNS